MAEFNKLSNLVGGEIKVETVKGYEYKFWDATNRKMLTSTTPLRDYRKVWQVVTDKGQLDMSQSQVANMLEGVMHAGQSDIIGVTYSVKSNGKSGMEIRYWLNPVRTEDNQENPYESL